MPEHTRLLTDPSRFNVVWLSYDHWAPWRFDDSGTLSPMSLEKVDLPDPKRFDVSGTKFSGSAHLRAIHTMGESGQNKAKDHTPGEATEEENPKAKLRRAVSHAEEAVSHLEPLDADPGGGGNIDAISDFIGEDRNNLTGARKTLQDLLSGRHEVTEAIEENLAEWMPEERDTFAQAAAHRLARLLLSHYMRAVADAFREFAAREGAMEDAPEARDGPLSDDELIGVPSSSKGKDLEALYWEDTPPAPCRDLVDEYLEGRSLEDLAVTAAYPVSIQLADQAFDEVEAPPSDGEIENYVQNCSGEAIFEYAVKIAVRTVAFGVLECLEDEGLTADRIEELLDVEADGSSAGTPTPKPETPDYDPDPHTGSNETAGLLAGSFSNIMTGAMMDAGGDPAPTKQGEWGRGPGGGPVRVEKLKNPYEGRAVLKVQAHADADPAEVEAAMGWEMLERMDMDTVWLHLLLLGHASAPHRREDRSVMNIPRKRVENALGIRRNRNMTVRERAERVKKHVEALQSLSVQFQGVRRHGDKLHFEGDMTASPLWFVQMKAKGQKDLFTGEVTADWYVQAKEGVWGSEFLHNHGGQWTPLPKEWFDQIDRRGKDWTQRLAVALLFLFRINAKRGGVVKLRAEKMLDICGTDMEGSSRRRTERKRRLSKALDALRERYNIGVEAGRVHIDNTSGISHADWKGRTATFHPPDEMSGELFRNENDGRPPLPDVKGGDWTAAQIKQLRSDLGDTQSEFAEKLGVSRQMVSRYENRHDPPSDDVRKTLDRLDSRFR